MTTTQTPGRHAPPFSLPTQGARSLDSRSLEGKPWVLYFFNRPFSPSAIALALAFRDHRASFEELGIQVVGASAGTPRQHGAFDRQHLLDVPLLSDPEGELSRGFGAWRDSSLFGLRQASPRPSAFLVAADGSVVGPFDGRRPRHIAEQALAAARTLFERAA